MTKKDITIYSLKYDHSINYKWNATVIDQTDEYIIAFSEPGREIIHYGRNTTFSFDSWAIDYLPLNKWFTANLSISKDSHHKYYCNICKPLKISNNIISYVDLDIDYVFSNGIWKVIDEDDFKINQLKYKYPSSLIQKVQLELDNLINNVTNKKHPFDNFLEKYLLSI
jgi:protein associated with RNAse G/E